ncbi:hypothetical protein ALC60_11007 [Trachymyrmex zeteki]|uniref:GIY-YIG domain-containing protein n=1 Tax=Mycetomoellerius zeteki TaxID=64791 RepID=A0A151WPK4_9HYME|nr:hypothetical protein ALC60_11007 [Trachymyrmex zeteki]
MIGAYSFFAEPCESISAGFSAPTILIDYATTAQQPLSHRRRKNYIVATVFYRKFYNSFELVKKLKDIKINPGYSLISLDVKRWNYFSNNCIIRFMQELEHWMLSKLDFHVQFYFRYVDDILICLPASEIENIHKLFNSFHFFRRLQFSIEIGGNIDNHSQHPLSQKEGVILGLVDRIFWLSHPEFQEKNLNLVKKILIENDYPINFILKTISERIKLLIKKTNSCTTNNKSDSSQIKKHKIKWFTIPYVQGISEKFKNFINGIEQRVSFFSLNKLNKFIKVHKDPSPNEEKRNIVYKINCKECDASYVGQTGRKLKRRIAEHRNNIRRDPFSHSIISEHRLHHNHDFNWNDVEVLDVESYYYKRLTSEMIHIKRQTNDLNLH